MPDLYNYTPVPCIKKLLSTVLKLILIYASETWTALPPYTPAAAFGG